MVRHASVSCLYLVIAVFGCSGSSSPHETPAPPRASASAVALAAPPSPSASAGAFVEAPGPTDAPAPVPEVEVPSRATLPPGFVYVPDPMDDHWKPTVHCGDFAIQNVQPANMTTSYEPFVVVNDKAGKKVYEAHGRLDTIEGDKFRRSLVVDICGDLTGDGIPEIIMTERTMGAHCCYTHYVVSLTNPSSRLLMWEKGDSGDGLVPIKLGKGKSYQLISYDRIFPPFKGEKGEPPVSYADVPGYPILFELVGSEYKARTFLFTDALRGMREKGRAECKTQPGCEISELYEWGLALIIGDWDQQKATILPDPEDRKVFDRRSAEMRSLLRHRLGP